MFKNVGIAVAGQMGRGIAEVCARAGLAVTLYDISRDTAAGALAAIDASLARAEQRAQISAVAREQALAAIQPTADIALLADADLIIEAATEREDLKIALFRQLDEVAAPSAVLASNTSSIPIARLADATSRPEHVVGLHFFNPVPRMPLVEIIRALRTSEATAAAVREFAADVLGKTVISAQDRAGFVVNSLLVPYLLAAIRMLDAGHATAEDIDTGMTAGCAHPMGPLHLADLIGLDTVAAIGEAMFEEYREPLYAPPPLLRRMVESGLLGRKTGRGFFAYPAA
jgi:3-hydroxybutyryl-CoA dehydrogenase